MNKTETVMDKENNQVVLEGQGCGGGEMMRETKRFKLPGVQ